MLPNGLLVVLDMALGVSKASSQESANQYRRDDKDFCVRYGLYVLGMFREDVVLYPGIGKATPSPSGGHIFPFATLYFLKLYYSAIRLYKRGHHSRAYFRFGQAIHVLIDMACPAHAHPAWHCSHDPFERFVEAHTAEIAEFSLPPVSDKLTPRQLIRSLTKMARGYRADHTQSPWGRWLRGRGVWTAPDAKEITLQVKTLMPLAAAHVRVLLQCFECDLKVYQTAMIKNKRVNSNNAI